MYVTLRKFLQQFFGVFNLGLVKKNDLKSLQKIYILYNNLASKLAFFFKVEDLIEDPNIKILSRSFLINDSKSENGQDIFALFANNFKSGGSFLEFGAYDGVTFSNTYLLEKNFGWQGLIIDPIPSHFNIIKQSRSCQQLLAAVTPEKQKFVKVVEEPASNLSKITERKILSKLHTVPAFTLTEILDKYFLSKDLDFLSIDTEGNDIEILKSINIINYRIKSICVEHNNRLGSEEVIKYMDKVGYKLAFREYSKNDYWFLQHN
jgi:FkbM family methyltransferase